MGSQLDLIPPLSDKQILDKCHSNGVPVKFVEYEELRNMQKLDEHLPMILLYQLHKPVGHWVSLFLNEEGINYHDPLGHVPDELLKTNFDHPAGRQAMGADFTYLTALLYKFCQDHKCKCIYNEIPLQSSHTSTCGYFSTVRLLSSGITNNDYNQMWMKKFPKWQDRELAMVKLYQQS
jgi:hypothetical protein